MSAELILIFGLMLLGFAIYLFVSSLIAGDDTGGPLSWASGEKPKEKNGIVKWARPFVHKFTIPIVRRYGFKEYRAQIKKRITSAGMSDQLNDEEYVGLQIFLGVFAPAILAMGNVLFSIGYPPILIIGFAVFGWLVPKLETQNNINRRRSQVSTDLPFVIDLLALSIEAGSDFMQALQKVVERLKGGALQEELQQVIRDITLGSSREDALNAMKERLDMPEIRSFVAVLNTAQQTGSPIGLVLRQQSEQMRQQRFTRAEKLGAEASQKVFLPLMLFILPAVFIVIFGPVIIQFLGVK